jgi:hypothetical protein
MFTLELFDWPVPTDWLAGSHGNVLDLDPKGGSKVPPQLPAAPFCGSPCFDTLACVTSSISSIESVPGVVVWGGGMERRTIALGATRGGTGWGGALSTDVPHQFLRGR